MKKLFTSKPKKFIPPLFESSEQSHHSHQATPAGQNPAVPSAHIPSSSSHHVDPLVQTGESSSAKEKSNLSASLQQSSSSNHDLVVDPSTHDDVRLVSTEHEVDLILGVNSESYVEMPPPYVEKTQSVSDQQAAEAEKRAHENYTSYCKLFNTKAHEPTEKLRKIILGEGQTSIIDLYFINAIILDTPRSERHEIKRKYQKPRNPHNWQTFRRDGTHEWQIILDLRIAYPEKQLRAVRELIEISLLGPQDHVARTLERATHGNGTNENSAFYILFDRSTPFMELVAGVLWVEKPSTKKKTDFERLLDDCIKKEFSGNCEHFMLALASGKYHDRVRTWDRKKPLHEAEYTTHMTNAIYNLENGPAIHGNRRSAVNKGAALTVQAMRNSLGLGKNKKPKEIESGASRSQGHLEFKPVIDHIRELEPVVQAVLYTKRDYLVELNNMLEQRGSGLVKAIMNQSSSNKDIQWGLIYVALDALGRHENDLKWIEHYMAMRSGKLELTHKWDPAALLVDTITIIAERARLGNDRGRLENLISGKIEHEDIMEWVRKQFAVLSSCPTLTMACLRGFIEGHTELPKLEPMMIEHHEYNAVEEEEEKQKSGK